MVLHVHRALEQEFAVGAVTNVVRYLVFMSVDGGLQSRAILYPDIYIEVIVPWDSTMM
tara:strand:+ start:613 stop:786 length:174 start_codon:yes stop_codon:yes gene_type:complete